MKLNITKTHPTSCNGLIFKICIFTLIFLCNFNVNSQTTYNITNPNQVTAAFSATLVPGDTVILADGIYASTGTMKFNAVGTAAMPITLRAQTPGGVKFTGGYQLKIGGDYVIVDGFHWKGGNGASNFIEFRDSFDYANHSIIQNCVIDGLQVSGGSPINGASVKHNWIVMYGTYNTIINCSLMNKPSSGNMILVELQYNAAPDGVTNTRCEIVGHTISNNYFYNYPKIDPSLTNSGDSETIRIGTSEYQNVNSNATVSNNYFVMADGENEIITNKSKGNSYINNTFRKCRGSLVLRHGSNTTVDGNYFLGENVDGTGGIRIVDSYQTITNNYIQDCITVGDNAIWNNGITFLGGNDSNAVVCSSTSMTNGYQKVENLNLSNNTIVNTNAPLFFNINQGTTKPTGTVSNNLIYYSLANPNITPVITGNTSTPIPLGTALTYSGNVYKETTLGQTTYPGFTEDAEITATPSGEIFTFTGASGKGADMGAYLPTTDTMVGNGIGACFVNNLGANITNGNCAIIIPESLIVGTLSPFSNVAESKNVSVTANVNWTAVSNNGWITINTNAGSGDATVSVSVTENTGAERTGSITFTQDPGGNNIVRTLTVTQTAPPPPDPREGKTLINFVGDTTPVEAIFACNEEVIPPSKNNHKENSLDKNLTTQWSGSGAISPCVGNNVSIIYDLKGAFDLELVDIATSNNKTYKLQIWVSSTGTNDSDFTNAFPPDSEWQLSNLGTAFKAFVLPNKALGTKYVKIIGNGQVESTTSRFTSIHEIEFYGNESSLSMDDNQVNTQVKMYPNPVSEILTLSQIRTPINVIQVFTLDGRKVMEKSIKSLETEIKIDISSFSNGAYILHVNNKDTSKQSKMFIVSR